MSDNDNSNIVILPVETTLDIPVERVLDGVLEHTVEPLLVLGWATDEDEFYMASTTKDPGKLLELIERARLIVLRRIGA